MTNVRQGSIDTRVHNLYREATNLKTSQFTGWDSIRCYEVSTTTTWDYSFTPTWSGSQTESGFDVFVKFIADHQQAPFAKPIMDILVNDAAHHRVGTLDSNATDTNSDYGVYTNGWVDDTFGNYSPLGTPNQINEKSWYNYVDVFRSSVVNVKIKIRIYSTDSGRMIVGLGRLPGTGFDNTIIIQ